MDIFSRTTLHNGVQMPWLGLGVYQAHEGGQIERAIQWAADVGYRLIDTASMYGNEAGVGRAVRQSGVAREEFVVTTKVWNSDQGYDATLRAFERSLDRLQMEYVDLYLIHWPVRDRFRQTWKALESLYDEGLCKAIGVSNFQVHHLQDLFKSATVVPMVNQVEYHPWLRQEELLRFCHEKQIQVQAWAPLMRGEIGNVAEVCDLAQKYGKSPAQIVLRWDLQNSVVTIPKSVQRERLNENANIFDFELSTDDMAWLNGIKHDRRVGPNPDQFSF